MKFCPECGIGLDNKQASIRFCNNCKAHWDEDLYDDDEDDFEPCSNCDLPDACADFGCISEQMKALANKVSAKYGLAPCDPIGWLYAMTDIYNIGFNDGLTNQK
jgi:hypothetical protein